MDIVLTCPQCGGQVDLEEDDSVFRCQYCDSVLKPTGRNEVQSFFFPPKGTKKQVGKALAKGLKKKGVSGKITKAYLVYTPYWRVRGMLFQWVFGRKYEGSMYGGTSFDHFKRLRATAYDRTFPSFSSTDWEVFSLGFRAQVMKMWPYNKDKMGQGALVLGQDIPLEEAIKIALQASPSGSGGPKERVDMTKTDLIGEGYSLLYFPFYCFTMDRGDDQMLVIVDALSHKVVKGKLSINQLLEDSSHETIPYKPLDFIPFKCPNCGWDLPFRPHTKIHLCRTCGRAWQELGGSYHEVFYKVSKKGVSKEVKNWTYLPFWKLTVAIGTPQKEYQNLREFYEVFPLPKVMDKEALERRAVNFYIPAFKIRNANAVDKFAAQLTKSQPVFDEDDPDQEFREIQAGDVWLPLAEAMEMAQLLLYSMSPKRAKRTHNLIKDAQVRLTKKSLIWLPFQEKGIFMREACTDFAIQTNCLEI